MKINSNIPPAVLAAATGCLQPYCEQLNPQNLHRALTSYKTEAKKQSSKLLSYSEVANILNVSRMTVCRMINRGELPRVKVGKRSVRIPESAIESLLNGES